MSKGLYDAETPEEVEAAIKENFPDKIEFEPGKFAVYDPERNCWIYRAPDGTEAVIQI